jgi:transposase
MDAKDKKIAELEEIIEILRAEIAELKRKLGLNPGTSSKPPSSEGLRKKRRIQSLRQSGKQKGGQKGHEGHKGDTLNCVQNPDVVNRHEVRECEMCGSDLRDVEAEEVVRRQVFDVEIKRVVTEHQVEVKRCNCGARTRASFPESVRAPTQIGETARAIGVYLSEQFIAKARLSEVMEDLFGVPVSDTSLINYEGQLAGNLSGFYKDTLEVLKKVAVKHQDETGVRVNGKTEWIQVLSNESLTYLWHSQQRKSLLTGVSGICVHDHYKPYLQQTTVEHAFCNAHILRELQALIQYEKEDWASSMYSLLRIMCHTVKKDEQLNQESVALFTRAYDKIIKQGLCYHESLSPPAMKPAKGRTKRRIGHNLLLRLQEFKTETLRFLTNSEVPFTNNQAEQDLRMVKVKQKVSGCMRTTQGAKNFAIIRSFISTLRKNKLNVLENIKAAMNNSITFLDIFHPKPILMLTFYG